MTNPADAGFFIGEMVENFSPSGSVRISFLLTIAGRPLGKGR